MLSIGFLYSWRGLCCISWGFPCGSAGRESACNAGDPSSIPGSERSPGEGKGYPLQYSGLENSMDCISLWSQTPLSDFHFSSVQFSRSVVSDSLLPHELQHARPPCPSPTPGVYPNSCPLSWWCHPTISSSVVPFSSALNLPQHQGLFRWVSSSHQVAKILAFQLQHQSFQWTPRTDLL